MHLYNLLIIEKKLPFFILNKIQKPNKLTIIVKILMHTYYFYRMPCGVQQCIYMTNVTHATLIYMFYSHLSFGIKPGGCKIRRETT